MNICGTLYMRHWISNSTCHIAYLLYSQSKKIRPPVTFISAFARTFILSQVSSRLESTVNCVCKYSIYFYATQLIISFRTDGTKLASAFLWFDASDPHHQVSWISHCFLSLILHLIQIPLCKVSQIMYISRSYTEGLTTQKLGAERKVSFFVCSTRYIIIHCTVFPAKSMGSWL